MSAVRDFPASFDQFLGGDARDRLEIEVTDLQRHLTVDRIGLEWLARKVLLLEEVRRATISIVLVDDAAIHEINRRELGHDWPTDVITFGLSGPEDEPLTAELIVSIEMAVATARLTGGEAFDELSLYVVHGLLHLCDYNDQTPEQILAIRRRETEVLAALGRSNPFSSAIRAAHGREEGS